MVFSLLRSLKYNIPTRIKSCNSVWSKPRPSKPTGIDRRTAMLIIANKGEKCARPQLPPPPTAMLAGSKGHGFPRVCWRSMLYSSMVLTDEIIFEENGCTNKARIFLLLLLPLLIVLENYKL